MGQEGGGRRRPLGTLEAPRLRPSSQRLLEWRLPAPGGSCRGQGRSCAPALPPHSRSPAARCAASQPLAGPGAGPGRGRQDGRRAPQRADHAGGLPSASGTQPRSRRPPWRAAPAGLLGSPSRRALRLPGPREPSRPEAVRTRATRPEPGAEGATRPRGETGPAAAGRLGTRGARDPRLLREAAAWGDVLAAAALSRKPSEAARCTWPHCPPVASPPNDTPGPRLGVGVTCPRSACFCV
ncbi:uncharacterized protein LOC141583517 [Saimiri boliviensis]|uniref:uncharacterized protein LOC141583517 n=1 Tax=Saimiri boliviensis TaxID=27679 RepID=UPI003D770365